VTSEDSGAIAAGGARLLPLIPVSIPRPNWDDRLRDKSVGELCDISSRPFIEVSK
jgi:hypothetical protein